MPLGLQGRAKKSVEFAPLLPPICTLQGRAKKSVEFAPLLPPSLQSAEPGDKRGRVCTSTAAQSAGPGDKRGRVCTSTAAQSALCKAGR